MSKILTIALTLGATFSVGILSYAGALAIGSGLFFAYFAGLITAVIEYTVYANNIQSAFNKLKKDIKDKNYKKLLSFAMISILFAISLGATTLNSAVGLFTFTPALLIAMIATVSWAFIMYITLCKIQQLFDTTNKEHKFLKSFKKILSFQKSRKTHKSLYYKITSALISMVTYAFIASSLYLIYVTQSTWIIETKSGLDILMANYPNITNILRYCTAPFAIACMNLFLFSNAMKTIINYGKSIAKKNWQEELEQLKTSAKDNPGISKNPFYWLIKIISASTALGLNVTHSICQALIAGRSTPGTATGAVSDCLCDQHFIAGNGPGGCHTHTHSHDDSDTHDHLVMDFITLVVQTGLTLIFQPFAIAWNYYASKNAGKTKPLTECAKESFYFVFKFWDENKENLGFGHADDGHGHSHGTPPPAVIQPIDTTTPPAVPPVGTVAHNHAAGATNDTGAGNNPDQCPAARP